MRQCLQCVRSRVTSFTELLFKIERLFHAPTSRVMVRRPCAHASDYSMFSLLYQLTSYKCSHCCRTHERGGIEFPVRLPEQAPAFHLSPISRDGSDSMARSLHLGSPDRVQQNIREQEMGYGYCVLRNIQPSRKSTSMSASPRTCVTPPRWTWPFASSRRP